ncbi:MAG: hypothetical protein A3A98_00125 [Candidatus Staskawiczbacteria bacterium RIFCSPLOWO2_01_FULL_40_39]|uniref:Uncharacterized protein n=1 Tax=Candidatus Staskawiczbacteria bacterium RIFCSPHIGHO2_01_FULL_39_25 TaxID=1802202 RepID=A0A1G2HMD4_9BACT|nr:MAG: hypothetical protein A2730_00125 [Candidatus Staskawiczbacteria bacterium RIFCSPHIGHO2_01_FULL_39_25]OGZ73149.1 MAG: hypothetical protein A3A98_00125 [Candidatus Staskawiczbacteria bacterium RIFCSPLOWO2_01_FULL_40_39]OGZ76514.1 MAG: hypothetical protein A3I87_01165 [Candidatus Staskawiczbacteria bacterium RIFCSPLOWO2_02_FULL_39_8]
MLSFTNYPFAKVQICKGPKKIINLIYMIIMDPQEVHATAGFGQVDLIVSSIAIFIGLVSIYLIIKLTKNLGGKIKSALQFFILGVSANILAMIWNILFGHTFTISIITVDAHNILMAIGMIFFIISTYRFSLLIPRN